jgi:hypothetical protein
VVSSRARRTRIGFIDGWVFIQYIIRKAVIVFITAFFVLERKVYWGPYPTLGILADRL